MLELDTVRGPHSTGVMFLPCYEKNEHEVLKKLGTPWEMFQYNQWKPLFNAANNILMGHNRWATTGAINSINAHPFEVGNLVGAHNGTLANQALLDDHLKFNVDSENIYHHMNKNGVSDTVSKLDGAYALSWFNKEEGTINFIRNKERTLFWTRTDDGLTLFWASEQWMLVAALHHANVKHGDIKAFAEHQHYKMEIAREFPTQAKKLSKWQVRKVEAYVKPVSTVVPFVGHGHGGSYYAKGNISTDFHPYSGKTCYFYLDGIGVTPQGQEYIQGSLSVDYKIPVRVFLPGTSTQYDKLSKFRGRLSGFCGGYTMAHGGYLTMTPSSIVSAPLASYKATQTHLVYPIFDNIMVSLEKWKEKTKNGCSWCSDVVLPGEADGLVWTSADDFVCEGCCETPAVKEYLM